MDDGMRWREKLEARKSAAAVWLLRRHLTRVNNLDTFVSLLRKCADVGQDLITAAPATLSPDAYVAYRLPFYSFLIEMSEWLVARDAIGALGSQSPRVAKFVTIPLDERYELDLARRLLSSFMTAHSLAYVENDRLDLSVRRSAFASFVGRTLSEPALLLALSTETIKTLLDEDDILLSEPLPRELNIDRNLHWIFWDLRHLSLNNLYLFGRAMIRLLHRGETHMLTAARSHLNEEHRFWRSDAGKAAPEQSFFKISNDLTWSALLDYITTHKMRFKRVAPYRVELRPTKRGDHVAIYVSFPTANSIFRATSGIGDWEAYARDPLAFAITNDRSRRRSLYLEGVEETLAILTRAKLERRVRGVTRTLTEASLASSRDAALLGVFSYVAMAGLAIPDAVRAAVAAAVAEFAKDMVARLRPSAER